MERKELLDVLGLSGSPTPIEIKAAHRTQSKRHHPDAGGSDAAMATINHAVSELLANPALTVPTQVTTPTWTGASSITLEPADDPKLWALLAFFVGVPAALIGVVFATVMAVVGL